MTASTQCKKPQLPSLKTSKANLFLVTRYHSTLNGIVAYPRTPYNGELYDIGIA